MTTSRKHSVSRHALVFSEAVKLVPQEYRTHGTHAAVARVKRLVIVWPSLSSAWSTLCEEGNSENTGAFDSTRWSCEEIGWYAMYSLRIHDST